MSRKKGEGIAPPNYTQTPNLLFDDLLPVMSNAELRITLVAIRLTIGWHEIKTETLSVTELAEKAGLSPSSAKTGIAEAMKRGTLKRHKTRDSQNRQTYRYSLALSNSILREEFERPKKQVENRVQNGAQPVSSGQNLTGSEIDGVNGSSGQNLTGSPEDSSGQNLTGSYKEQRNLSGGKEKEREQAAPAALEPTQPGSSQDGREGPADAGAAHASAEDPSNPSQDQTGDQGRHDEPATDTEEVPGAAAAARTPEQRAETEAYLRRKLSHKFVSSLLDEIQPLGVNRKQDWFDIPLDRVKALMTEAVNTHDKFDVKVPTRLRDLLDEECRRKNVPFTPSSAPAPLDEDGEVDMDALMASAPRNGTARRAR